ncbi:MAG: PD40 domain-containing protein [Sporocytophaga sp.]|uniref:T9SS type A sorting domain-containing protein n=1 Tax=Sporocytophaga sp. TaxID=2231183 RepID=UPI001B03F62D|nr:T9SS type A sorting domain-containing protein [Sporocytophaga sp.]MBO9701856.1 PD40 domain-containing protein [Sporocytophaga sp.]
MRYKCIYIFIVISCITSILQAGTPSPITSGQIVYHSYSNYEAWDSQLYLLNLETGVSSMISGSWNIDHAMNPHFSNDGTKIVFMGVPKGKHNYWAWEIFLWDFSSDEPLNLTQNGERDEDPKFSPDGKSIVFKQNGDIRIMDLEGNILKSVTDDWDNPEESMPYFVPDGKEIVYSQGAGAGSDIYKINFSTGMKTPLAAEAGVQEYYSITKDENTFLYARWLSASNHHDQIYTGYFNGNTPQKALFNREDADCSDPYPVDEKWVAFSMNQSGNYDLALGNLITGEIYDMNSFGINTSLHELGACYTPFSGKEVTSISSTQKIDFKASVEHKELSIQWTNQAQASSYSAHILNLDGQLLLTKSINNDSLKSIVNMASFPSGIYFLIVLSNENQIIFRTKISI